MFLLWCALIVVLGVGVLTIGAVLVVAFIVLYALIMGAPYPSYPDCEQRK